MLQNNLEALGLPLASLEDEWGPGQCELTFSPLPAMEAADCALLFRTAVKQLCRRHGYHASFMAVPKIANSFPSGWHMHQSLTRGGANLFAAGEGDPGPLSLAGMHYLGGLLDHASATALLTTPTINGYKRQRPDGFAPYKAAWAQENRGAMLRVIGDRGDSASRIENRIGDPAANPYLYIASQIIAGRAGMQARSDPGAPVAAAYLSERAVLPGSLGDALSAFANSAVLRAELGETFHHYFHSLKQFEWNRFLSAVTDWDETRNTLRCSEHEQSASGDRPASPYLGRQGPHGRNHHGGDRGGRRTRHRPACVSETFLSGYPFWVCRTNGAAFDDARQGRAYASSSTRRSRSGDLNSR